uniref:Uncharacterized protein n=1 Tax=Rhizophora mucronata TaxID=61149 RepID=A0A2P2NBL5_RHIMU
MTFSYIFVNALQLNLGLLHLYVLKRKWSTRMELEVFR